MLYLYALPHRTYRLEDVSQHRSSRETCKVRDCIKWMKRTVSGHQLNEEEPVMVIEFLTRFIREENFQEMYEAQALEGLPSFFKGFAKS